MPTSCCSLASRMLLPERGLFRSRRSAVLQFQSMETDEKLAIFFGLLIAVVILAMAVMRSSGGCHDEPCGNASPPVTHSGPFSAKPS